MHPSATKIIEDSANRFWAVWETGEATLAHVFWGVQIKRSGGTFVPKAKARTELVRKACTKVIATLN